MSEQEFGSKIPESYSKAYDVASLFDPAEVNVQDQVRKDALAFADASVQAIHRIIYPAHGLQGI